ncbi:hypothetical protein WM08_15045 [Burkholderia ubonensis]|uniref:hypothetical protein n=1 Tax=Burkholderia ubonensis TaxID=101571 RepID=UPI00075FE38A|nr:hypothetical protein [Burkholderia ubonensis]KWI90172.1 hypothetical protein WM08_15045 [Burkholderia ubonensis]
MRNDATTQFLIYQLLKEQGPMTSFEIAKMLGRNYESIRSAISSGRKESVRRFYIVGYDEPAGSGYTRPAIYANGNREDAPYPHLGMHQKYARAWQRKKMKRQIQAAGKGNHFASLIAQVTK